MIEFYSNNQPFITLALEGFVFWVVMLCVILALVSGAHDE
jgi:hypothetical protein